MSAPRGEQPCVACGLVHPRGLLVPLDIVRPKVADLIRAEHPVPAGGQGAVCQPCLNLHRAKYVETVLETERGELSVLDREVVRSLAEQEMLTRNVSTEFEQASTLGQRMADRVATFGGSWTFVITFLSLLGLWILVNAVALLGGVWDPYPFILLNLILSTLAALQAPIIMMSQNRQEAKDRLRAEHDYKINLKAELEIRHLHAKMDQLLTHMWQRLLEIQEIQTDLMEEILERRRRGGGEGPEGDG